MSAMSRVVGGHEVNDVPSQIPKLVCEHAVTLAAPTLYHRPRWIADQIDMSFRQHRRSSFRAGNRSL